MDTLKSNEKKLNLINSTYKTLKQLENYKNETILSLSQPLSLPIVEKKKKSKEHLNVF
jgi:hypothetical protein